ncbi:MAG: tetratricopeptide repeat protein [bacterium]|nr:tetratricopeptide repeat protein [bacterium]
MIFRAVSYVAIAAIIIAVAVFLNRDGDREDVRLGADPMQSRDRGPHQHDFLDPSCECDPEAEIKQAIADRQDYSSTHTDLGKGFYARGRYDVAKSCYERALELEETNHQARYGLALTHIRLGDLVAARQELQRAVEANRKFLPAYISLAVLDYADGDYGMAKERLQGALRIEPSNPHAKKLLNSLPKVQRYADANSG